MWSLITIFSLLDYDLLVILQLFISRVTQAPNLIFLKCRNDFEDIWTLPSGSGSLPANVQILWESTLHKLYLKIFFTWCPSKIYPLASHMTFIILPKLLNVIYFLFFAYISSSSQIQHPTHTSSRIVDLKKKWPLEEVCVCLSAKSIKCLSAVAVSYYNLGECQVFFWNELSSQDHVCIWNA